MASGILSLVGRAYAIEESGPGACLSSGRQLTDWPVLPVSLNNPRNSGTVASDVAARLRRVKFTGHASSGEQAPCEERSSLRARRRGRALQSTEVKRRGPRIIQY